MNVMSVLLKGTAAGAAIGIGAAIIWPKVVSQAKPLARSALKRYFAFSASIREKAAEVRKGLKSFADEARAELVAERAALRPAAAGAAQEASKL